MYPKELKAGTQIFRAAVFTIARRWTPSKHPPADKWINKRWCVHAQQRIIPPYSGVKSDTCTAWMNLEDIMPSGISQSQRSTCCVLSLMRSLEQSNQRDRK